MKVCWPAPVVLFFGILLFTSTTDAQVENAAAVAGPPAAAAGAVAGSPAAAGPAGAVAGPPTAPVDNIAVSAGQSAATTSQPNGAIAVSPVPQVQVNDEDVAPPTTPIPDDMVATSPSDAVGITSGAEAVAYLTQRNELAEVAQAYGQSTSELAHLLRNNKDLKLATGSNKLLYACTGLAFDDSLETITAGFHHHHHHHRKLAELNTEIDDPLPSDLKLTVSGVPILHSRSSATRKIYLDFDGHVTTGTDWNNNCARSVAWNCTCRRTSSCGTIITPPYDRDGVAGFSEREKISMM